MEPWAECAFLHLLLELLLLDDPRLLLKPDVPLVVGLFHPHLGNLIRIPQFPLITLVGGVLYFVPPFFVSVEARLRLSALDMTQVPVHLRVLLIHHLVVDVLVDLGILFVELVLFLHVVIVTLGGAGNESV